MPDPRDARTANFNDLTRLTPGAVRGTSRAQKPFRGRRSSCRRPSDTATTRSTEVQQWLVLQTQLFIRPSTRSRNSNRTKPARNTVPAAGGTSTSLSSPDQQLSRHGLRVFCAMTSWIPQLLRAERSELRQTVLLTLAVPSNPQDL